jgi:FkbM family methyltransferase
MRALNGSENTKGIWVLISVKDISQFWRVNPTGVVHVGAHEAEEAIDYQSNKFTPVIWIEAQPDLAEKLSRQIQLPSLVIQGLVWDTSGEKMNLKITNNGQSSSVFSFGSHATNHPDVRVVSEVTLTTVRLDEIIPNDTNHNFLNLDIQGAEYQALVGLGSRIAQFDFIYCEVNREQVYEGTRQVGDLDSFLNGKGFRRVATRWTHANWGDALYIRQSIVSNLYGSTFNLNILRLRYAVQSIIKDLRYRVLKFLVWLKAKAIKG